MTFFRMSPRQSGEKKKQLSYASSSQKLFPPFAYAKCYWIWSECVQLLVLGSHKNGACMTVQSADCSLSFRQNVLRINIIETPSLKPYTLISKIITGNPSKQAFCLTVILGFNAQAHNPISAISDVERNNVSVLMEILLWNRLKNKIVLCGVQCSHFLKQWPTRRAKNRTIYQRTGCLFLKTNV